MSRTNSRSEKMDKTIIMRATAADKAALKLAAYNKGLDCSGFLRKLLIENKVIHPNGVSRPAIPNF